MTPNVNDKPLRLAISAGEVSADRHAARVIRALRRLYPEVEVRGMGGASLRQIGAEIIVDSEKSGAVMGIGVLLRPLVGIIKSFFKMSRLVKEWKPDALLLIDYPDFNLRLGRAAKKSGVKTLYYIPPKVWVWRQSRVKRIATDIDQVAVIFPFERDFYLSKGYEQVEYLGHPVLDEYNEALRHTDEEIRTQLGSKSNEDLLLILPGSRKFEVERLLRPILKAYVQLKDAGSMRPVIALAPTINPELIKEVAVQELGPVLFERLIITHLPAQQVMRVAKAGILKSGTCNLEAACAGLPFVCVYSMSLLARGIANMFIPLKEFSPVNIIVPHTVPEIIAAALNPDTVRDALEGILSDNSRRAGMVAGLRRVKETLELTATENRDGTVAERCADWILKSTGRK